MAKLKSVVLRCLRSGLQAYGETGDHDSALLKRANWGNGLFLNYKPLERRVLSMWLEVFFPRRKGNPRCSEATFSISKKSL